MPFILLLRYVTLRYVTLRYRYKSSNSQNCDKQLLASTNLSRVRPSVSPHGTTRLPTRWIIMKFDTLVFFEIRSQRPRGLRLRSAAARLLRSWVRIPPGTWIFVCCECRVLSGRGLCNELITRPEESYRLCCVVVCDLETSRVGAPYIYIYI